VVGGHENLENMITITTHYWETETQKNPLAGGPTHVIFWWERPKSAVQRDCDGSTRKDRGQRARMPRTTTQRGACPKKNGESPNRIRPSNAKNEVVYTTTAIEEIRLRGKEKENRYTTLNFVGGGGRGQRDSKG